MKDTINRRKQQVHKPQGDLATPDISAFWAKCAANGTMAHVPKYADFGRFHGILVICFTSEIWIAVEKK